LGEEVSNNIQPRASYKKDSHVPKTDLMQMDATYSTFQNASAAAIQIKLQSMHPASSKQTP
jgi:hypothetical protein